MKSCTEQLWPVKIDGIRSSLKHHSTSLRRFLYFIIFKPIHFERFIFHIYIFLDIQNTLSEIIGQESYLIHIVFDKYIEQNNISSYCLKDLFVAYKTSDN